MTQRCLSVMIGMAALVLGSGSPLHAQGATASSPPELARMAEKLRPGQWIWAPQVAPAGPLLIYVDLSRQRATVYRNGIRMAVSTISSGKDGYATPTGVFTILQKDANHRSNVYNSAPMPFQQG
ncbi:L,D-transpeptidase family protein [Sphingomonas crusticola]|uniref:L,D-transpeptidase family protein n=1 Tax=Sphingomonas crusticola TaxID=1697973 RepID=UPI00308438E6